VNAGNTTAFNVVVLDTLPGLLSYVAGSAVAPADAGWDPAPGVPQRVRWSIGSIFHGRSVVVRFTARAGATGGSDRIVLNSALVHYTTSSGLPRAPAADFVAVRIRGGEFVPMDVRMIVEVFDSTGRLVATLNDVMVASPLALKLIADGRSRVDVAAGQPVPILLTDDSVLKWDTKDEDGIAVPSGFYTVRVTNWLVDGRADVCSGTFSLYRSAADVILAADAVPNPVSEAAWVRVTLASPWATLEAKVYNVAGELVRKIEPCAGCRSFMWDLKNRAGSRVAKGLYVIVLDARDPATGARERTTLKLAVERGK